MIQVNLLPDVKQEFVKARRLKRVIVLVSIAVSGVAVGVLAFTFMVGYLGQRKLLDNAQKEANGYAKELKAIKNIDKILTIQNQLGSLPDLHKQKPVLSRIFVYIQQITPKDVNVSSLKYTKADNTLSITGMAPSMESVNKYVDTLKFTKFTTSADKNKEENKVFSGVVMSFGAGDKESSFSINTTFDEKIFSGDVDNVALVIPNIVSTRSVTESPDTLFNQKATPTPSPKAN